MMKALRVVRISHSDEANINAASKMTKERILEC